MPTKSLITVCFLLLNCMVSSSLIAPRQDTSAALVPEPDAPTSTISASESAVPERPTVPTASAESDSAEVTASPTSAIESVVSNDAVIANSTSSATESIVTGTSKPLNSTNDPSNCHKDSLEEANKNPFCTPEEGEKIEIDTTYRVTWDPTFFPPNSTNNVEIYDTNFYQDSSLKFPAIQEHKLNTTNYTANVNGEAMIAISKDILAGNSTLNLTLLLVVMAPDEPRKDNLGPTVLLVNKKGSNSSADTDSDDEEKLGQKVGIPVGLIAFLAILAAIMFFILRRRRAGNGYQTSKSHSQRTAATPGLVGPHRRTSSFHDEPTRGMELQDREQGGDNWDWGSPTTSPTKGGNAFREEIGRQQTRKGW